MKKASVKDKKKKSGKEGKAKSKSKVSEVQAEQVLKRPGWPFPSADKVRKSLDPSDCCFLKVDLVEGYHQVEIREEDRDLTTTILPWGKFRYD